MNILITGGAGYIGSAVAQPFLADLTVPNHVQNYRNLHKRFALRFNLNASIHGPEFKIADQQIFQAV
jgi:nucleoside-diphosphate-sugar epimerase